MKNSLPVVVFSVCVLGPALALAGSLEVTPYVGITSGSFWLDTGIACVQGPCPSYLESEDGTVLGLTIDYSVSPRVDFEVVVGRQESGLEYRQSLDSHARVNLPTVDLDISHLEIGLRRRWELGRTEPFAAFGVGISRLDSGPFVGTQIDSDRSSQSLAGGARIELGERLGLRLELRGRRIDLPGGFHEVGSVAVNTVGGDLEQIQYLLGFSFKI